MPYLNIKLSMPENAATSAKVAALLTSLTAEYLGKKRELTSVAVDYVSAPHWMVGEQVVADRSQVTFYLEVKVTEGTNTKDQKAAYVAAVHDALQTLLGPLHEASYTVIHEVHADAWGFGGKTQEHRYIQGKHL